MLFPEIVSALHLSYHNPEPVRKKKPPPWDYHLGAAAPFRAGYAGDEGDEIADVFWFGRSNNLNSKALDTKGSAEGRTRTGMELTPRWISFWVRLPRLILFNLPRSKLF
jgi:hypothetical protein